MKSKSNKLRKNVLKVSLSDGTEREYIGKKTVVDGMSVYSFPELNTDIPIGSIVTKAELSILTREEYINMLYS